MRLRCQKCGWTCETDGTRKPFCSCGGTVFEHAPLAVNEVRMRDYQPTDAEVKEAVDWANQPLPDATLSITADLIEKPDRYAVTVNVGGCVLTSRLMGEAEARGVVARLSGMVHAHPRAVSFGG